LLVTSEKLAVVGELAAGMAHEIRNPLTSLKGFLQLLKTTTSGVNDQYYDIMQGELNRIELISSEMLVLGRPQAINFRLHLLSGILRNLIMLLDTQAIIRNVRIDLYDEPELQLFCDEHQVKQAFINLIKNAIEAMPNGGQLTITTRAIENAIQIEFTDDGVGIPSEVLQRLGEPFMTTKSDGTGLGLMVTKRIIQNHHGTIQISSEVGTGTHVVVKLPTKPVR
jgi:signal transduction histidine kinase